MNLCKPASGSQRLVLLTVGESFFADRLLFYSKGQEQVCSFISQWFKLNTDDVKI